MSDQKPKGDAKTEQPDEVTAIGAIMSALRPLDDEARLHVVEFVIRRLGIPIGIRSEKPQQDHSPASTMDAVQPPVPDAAPSATSTDIRSFAAEKNPKTVNEKVALVAYYLAHLAPPSERRDHIVSDDINTYFVQANFPLPTAKHSMTLVHAKNAGYLNALERGQYRLNAVGHNLVAHKLPGEKGAEPKRKPSRKSSKGKTGTKRRK